MICIACGKDLRYADSLSVPSDVMEENFDVRVCACGLGVTVIPESTDSLRANSVMYNDIAQRVSIYFHTLNGHITARYVDSLGQIEKQIPPGRNLLEVGSNIGYTTNLAKEFGFNVTACELNDRCRYLSEALFGFKTEKDLFALEKKYDVVIMCDVLEHFPDPLVALQKVKDILNPGGLLFIQLPNISSAKAKQAGAHWHFFCVPDHTFHFSPESLISLVKKCGLKPTWGQTVDFYDNHPAWKLVYPRRLRKLVKDCMLSLLPIGFNKCSNNSGEMIQFIARKEI